MHRFDGEKYVLNQTINISSYVFSLAVTPNHQYLVVGSYEVSVYKYDGHQYNFLQKFTYDRVAITNEVAITSDHQYITVAG